MRRREGDGEQCLAKRIMPMIKRVTVAPYVVAT